MFYGRFANIRAALYNRDSNKYIVGQYIHLTNFKGVKLMVNKSKIIKYLLVLCCVLAPVFIVVLSYNKTPPTAQTSDTPAVVQPQWQVLAPMTFTRDTGNPIAKDFTFSALGGTATLRLTNKETTSAEVVLNGQLIFGPSEFKKNATTLQKEISLVEGRNTLSVLLRSKPGSQITIQITQTVPEVTAEITLLETANALRGGNNKAVLKNVTSTGKTSAALGEMNQESLNNLGACLEQGQLIDEATNYRVYQCNILGLDGNYHLTSFTMMKNTQKQWLISSW